MTITDQLKNANATLVRQNKHLVYRLPNGYTFVMAKTPSDWRAELNQMRDLKRAKALDDARGQRLQPTPVTSAPTAPPPMIASVASASVSMTASAVVATSSAAAVAPAKEEKGLLTAVGVDPSYLKSLERTTAQHVSEIKTRIELLTSRIAQDTQEVALCESKLKSIQGFLESLGMTISYYNDVRDLLPDAGSLSKAVEKVKVSASSGVKSKRIALSSEDRSAVKAAIREYLNIPRKASEVLTMMKRKYSVLATAPVRYACDILSRMPDVEKVEMPGGARYRLRER